MIPFEPLRWAPAPRQAASLTNVSCLPAVQTFSLHIGADLKLPTPNAQRHSSYEAAPAAVSATQAASDPFEGLPFRALAERMGAAMSPVVQAVSTCSTSLARIECVHCAMHAILSSQAPATAGGVVHGARQQQRAVHAWLSISVIMATAARDTSRLFAVSHCS